MNILFIAPIPPPTNGQSLAAGVLYTKMKENHNVFLVNMAKPKREQNFFDKANRGLEVISFFKKIINGRKESDLIYLTLSESFGGNVKDLIIYVLCYDRLNNMVVHMLGGAGMKVLLEKGNLFSKINKFFLKRLKGVIVEGKIQFQTFSNVISSEKVHIIPNFSEDYLFCNESEVLTKFSEINKINILYLSNLIYGKGFEELADAYMALPEDIKDKFTLTFVGGFQSIKHQELFFKKIEKFSGISYKGKFINGNEKRNLYLKSHIFCLPTYYPYEGQPISILEAYATGCFVITTGHSGIPQIFEDHINGIMVEKKSALSIKNALELISNNKNLKEIALYNLSLSKKLYTKKAFLDSINSVLGI
jgi:glycosyltransferase involved in cell wall biosynthesis